LTEDVSIVLVGAEKAGAAGITVAMDRCIKVEHRRLLSG
jgi:predicted CoA-binding protein